LLNGMPGCPRLFFGIVDVRDVADLHLRAMTHPPAAGQRFIAASGDLLSMLDVARTLRAPPRSCRPQSADAGAADWLVRLAPLFDRTVKPLVSLLDSTRRATSAKAQRLLGWQLRTPQEAIIATAESLLTFGVVPKEPR
jgi:dihydroflavonol-4-reductase